MNSLATKPLYQNKSWLEGKYSELKSIYKVSELINCSPRTIHKWLIKFNIPRIGRNDYKHSQETKAKISEGSHHGKPMLGKHHSQKTKHLMSLQRSGCKNANWKGGKTERVRRFRHTKEYCHWRNEVISRANGVCQKCGAKAKLEAHHKIPIRENPSLAFDATNGIALCHKCHLDVEGRKSYESNANRLG